MSKEKVFKLSFNLRIKRHARLPPKYSLTTTEFLQYTFNDAAAVSIRTLRITIKYVTLSIIIKCDTQQNYKCRATMALSMTIKYVTLSITLKNVTLGKSTKVTLQNYKCQATMALSIRTLNITIKM
jgi:hypothetical protein